MYYLVIFLFLCFGALFELLSNNKKESLLLFVLTYLALMLTAGLRYETGGDWTSYTDIFNRIEPLDEVLAGQGSTYEAMPLETGYKVLNSILKLFVDNVQVLLFVVALIISTFIFKGIKRYSVYPITSALLYFGLLYFALDMIVLRQGVAVALVFWGYQYIEDRKFLKYLLVCCVAALFHVSALAGILVYPIVNRRYPTWALMGLFLVFLAVLLLQVRWLGGIATTLLSTQINPDLAAKIVAYTTNEGYAVSRGLSFGLLANIAVFVVLLLRRKALDKQPYFNLFLNLFMLYLFVYCCLSEFVEVGNRLKYYFMISLVVLVPQIIASFSIQRNRLVAYVGACMISFMYCHTQLLERPIASAFNPYQNYLIHSFFDLPSDGLERLEKSDEAFSKERNN